MIEIDIHGFDNLRLKELVMDFNGTLGIDGKFLEGVKEKLDLLKEQINIHILSADTYGNVASELQGSGYNLQVISKEGQAYTKMQYVKQLGPANVVCIGNGRNDNMMLKEAKLSIAVIQAEGCATSAMNMADIVCHNIYDALDLLFYPKRILATLRT
jgi:soluble P-type ATPase